MYATQSQTGKQMPSSVLRLMWLALIALTLGLCLLAPKRQALEPVHDEASHEPVTEQIKTVTAPPPSAAVVINVTRVDSVPIWSSATLTAEVMHDKTYDRY